MEQVETPNVKTTNLKRSLTIRFSLLLSIFLILLGTSYYFSSKTIAAKEYDSILLNLAGRQRTLIEQYAGETHRVLVGLASNDLQMALTEKKKIDKDAQVFEATHDAFEQGGEVVPSILDGKIIRIPPLANAQIKQQLEKVYEQWLELKRISLLSLRLDAQTIAKNRYVGQLRSQADNTINEMDTAVLMMQRDSDAKLRQLETLHMVVTIVGFVLFIILVYFVYYSIVKPLDKNIRALRHTSRTLAIEKVRAEKANQAKSEFLSRMSHELRTPLNAILGFGQLLRNDPIDPLNDAQNESVEEIIRAGQHLLALINEVLDLAKIESGKVALSVEPVALDPVVEECLKLVKNQAANRDITLRYSGIKEAAVRADRIRLKQVILNLLSNAIKYNREGGSVVINVAKAKEKNWLSIDVTDTGIGIAGSRLPELFEPFNRLDAENSDIEGTGIGLTLSRRIVELMGGDIGVKSTVGTGSTFTIKLPGETIANVSRKSIEPPVSTAKNDRGRYRLLYVEDNPANLRLVRKIVSYHKEFILLDAITGKDGLELSVKGKPDLILLDINLPDMSGYEVIRRLKSQNETKEIPVVAVTANAMSHDIKHAEEEGFHDYISKPIDVKNFIEVIRKHLHVTNKDSA